MTSLVDSFLSRTPEETVLVPWADELPDHLSATQLAMFQRCPEQYRRRYVLGEKERPGAALVWGSADHYAHEQNFIQKIKSGEDIPVREVQEAFAEGFYASVERNGGESEVEWGDEKPGDVLDAGARLVAVYHQQVSPSVQPLQVEREFSVDVPGVPVPFVGRIDIETAGPAIERKTAKQMQRKPKPDWRVQGLLYQAVTERPVDWHVSVKAKTPAVYTPTEHPELHMPLRERVVEAANTLVSHTARAIIAYLVTFGTTERWPGAITHPWSCDFCGYRPTCGWWGA